jgi:hypothetical protein
MASILAPSATPIILVSLRMVRILARGECLCHPSGATCGHEAICEIVLG